MQEELEKLKKYNETNVLNLLDTLNDLEKEKILTQVSKIDFELLSNLYKNIGKEETKEEAKIDPIDFIDKEKLSKSEIEEFENIGIDEIKQGRYAVITMAGGQRNKTWTQWTKRNIRV